MKKNNNLTIKDEYFGDVCNLLANVFSNTFVLIDFLNNILVIFNLKSRVLFPKVIYTFNNGIFFKGIVEIVFFNFKMEKFEFYGTLSYLIVIRSKNNERKVVLYEH